MRAPRGRHKNTFSKAAFEAIERSVDRPRRRRPSYLLRGKRFSRSSAISADSLITRLLIIAFFSK